MAKTIYTPKIASEALLQATSREQQPLKIFN
jgi:hypothetical protein